MIYKIILNNFQSHENSELEFHPGVNSIIGSSNNGKTVILRALKWVKDNRPSPDVLRSHWSDDEISVILDEIERYKKKDVNGYRLGEKDFKAVNRDVPDEIKEYLNLEDVNLQQQLDAPFLLSQSAGEVARFFNKTINLEVIDKVLAIVDSKKRQTNSDYKTAEKVFQEIIDELEKLDWLEKAEKDVEKLEEIEKEKEKIDTTVLKLKNKVDEYKELKKKATIIDLIPIQKRIEKIEKLKKEKEKIEKDKKKLSESIKEYKENKNKIKDIPDIDKEIKEINGWIALKKEKEVVLRRLEKGYQEYRELRGNIKIYKKGIISNIEKLPELCPVCGGRMK